MINLMYLFIVQVGKFAPSLKFLNILWVYLTCFFLSNSFFIALQLVAEAMQLRQRAEA